jgi:hypothetical protein
MPARRANWACDNPEARSALVMIVGATGLGVTESYVSECANASERTQQGWWRRPMIPRPG